MTLLRPLQFVVMLLMLFINLLGIAPAQAREDSINDGAVPAADAIFQDQDFISKAVDQQLASVGETLIYTVTFRNPKSVPLTQVVITDYYDARLINLEIISSTVGTAVVSGNTITMQDFELVPGQSISLVVQAQISSRARVGDLLASAATLESPNASIHVSNTVETAVLPGALPNTGELNRAAWLVWRLMPLMLLMSLLGFLAVSLRTYKRLRSEV